MTKLQIVTDNFLKQNQKVDTIKHTIQLLHDSIRKIQAKKKIILKRFMLLRVHLFPQITLLENQLEECLSAKSSYDKFVSTELNTTKLVAYALCALINVSDALKDSWKEHFDQLKTNFRYYFSKF